MRFSIIGNLRLEFLMVSVDKHLSDSQGSIIQVQ